MQAAMTIETTPSTADPRDLVRQATAGDSGAFEALYHDNIGRIYALCLRMSTDPSLAEELAQEAFIRAWEKLHTFRGAASFSTWLRGASLEIEGVTANIAVTGVNGDIEIESVTGNVEYEGSARSIDVAVVTGSITVRSTGVRSGSFESVQGSLYFEGSLAAGAELDFETVMGSVDLLLPADVSAEFDIETMTGEIENAFGQAARSTNRWLPSKKLSFSTGGGSADISIETLQGKVTLRVQ